MMYLISNAEHQWIIIKGLVTLTPNFKFLTLFVDLCSKEDHDNASVMFCKHLQKMTVGQTQNKKVIRHMTSLERKKTLMYNDKVEMKMNLTYLYYYFVFSHFFP